MAMQTEIREILKRMPYTLRVGSVPGGDTEYTNIQDAIDYAISQGDNWTIKIYPGIYTMTADLTAPANFILEGKGTANTILEFTGPAITNGIVINGDDVTIKNLTVRLAAGAGAGGSRPNVIYASGRTRLLLKNLRIIGDTTVADDGSDNRQCGILWDTVTDSKILACHSETNERHGIRLVDGSDRNTLSGNTCTGNLDHGIMLHTSDQNSIADNNCYNNTRHGILISITSQFNSIVGNVCTGNFYGIELEASMNTITGNACRYNNDHNIFLAANSYGCVISGNVCQLSLGGAGIQIANTSHSNTVVGNECFGNRDEGISLENAHYNTITGNTVRDNWDDGILVTDGSTHNVVADNIIYNNSKATNLACDNIAIDNGDYNLVQGNICRVGPSGNRAAYGISVVAGTENEVIDNDLYDSGLTAPFNDTATNTRLNIYLVPFSHGSDPQDSGYLIDLGGELARAWARLPSKVIQIVRMKIYARAAILSANAMRLEINVNGGADNEAFNTHATAAPNTPSTSTNFAADDVIYWTLASAQIVALLGGDSVEIKVLHEAAGDGDVATNAYFRTVEFEYV